MKNYGIVIAIILTGFEIISAQGENLFDDSFLHEIHFNNMDTTMIDGQKIYQMADMIFDGIAIDSIGIKDKGNISNNVPNKKLPFKIKTNKYVNGKKYDGIKEFTLHNNFQDPSMMREKLTYDFCKQLGLNSLRTAFAKVYINSKYWGLYTIVEGKDEFYKQQFDHRDADAVESLDFGNMCFVSNNPDDYNFEVSGTPLYKLENGDVASAFQRFALMIDKANNTDDAAYISEVSKYLNLKDFFKYQAANVYLMNFDSYIGFKGNQIYMYDTSTTIWQVVPWDFNASLNLWDNGSGQQFANAYEILPFAIENGCIAKKLNTVPELKNYYLNAMCDLVFKYGDTLTINSRIDFYKNQINEAVQDDWRKVYSNEEFDQTTEYGMFTIDFNTFEGLKTFFKERFLLIRQSLINEGFDCLTTSLEEFEKEKNKIKVYPNPTSGYINLKGNKKIQKVTIYDIHGRRLRQIKNPIFPLEVSTLNSGLYFVSALVENRILTGKLILEK